jgi:hypothetical protein
MGGGRVWMLGIVCALALGAPAALAEDAPRAAAPAAGMRAYADPEPARSCLGPRPDGRCSRRPLSAAPRPDWSRRDRRAAA